MSYAAVATTAIMACCYLLLRRGNAFAPGITPPPRLRRCTAALFAVIALSHIWYLPILWLPSFEARQTWYSVCEFIDYIAFVPLAMALLLSMLQDRQRPLWPACVAVAPIIAGLALYLIGIGKVVVPAVAAYVVALVIGFTVYMVGAVRQYGKWLHDNYADLEHKQIRTSLIVAAVLLIFFGLYSCEVGNRAFYFLIQVDYLLLIGFLLWRVETLSDLGGCATTVNEEIHNNPENADHDNIGELLQRHCIEAQLYLQHDLTITQLAKMIGTNRFYLSRYFSNNGTTYNAYINGLRINHFINIYQEALSSRQPSTAQQLAYQSGYRSYSTFSLAFKQLMGQNVTTWMRNQTS